MIDGTRIRERSSTVLVHKSAQVWMSHFGQYHRMQVYYLTFYVIESLRDTLETLEV